MPESSPISVGLAGDGDEVDAIRDVEAAFSVRLDYSDAPNWRTAGDVFEALARALPEEERERTDLWDRFSTAIAAETGVNPAKIERGSPLLTSQGVFWKRLSNASAILGLVVILCLILVVAVALLVGH